MTRRIWRRGVVAAATVARLRHYPVAAALRVITSVASTGAGGLGFRDVPGPFRIWAVSVLCLRCLLPLPQKNQTGDEASRVHREGVFDEAEPVVKIRSDIVSSGTRGRGWPILFLRNGHELHPR